MGSRGVAAALSGIAGDWPGTDPEATSAVPVTPPPFSGGSGSDLPDDWVAQLAAHNRANTYTYKPFPARQPMARRGSLPRASTIRMLPRPVRQRRRVRRVAARPARRTTRSRSPGRLADDPELAVAPLGGAA